MCVWRMLHFNLSLTDMLITQAKVVSICRLVCLEIAAVSEDVFFVWIILIASVKSIYALYTARCVYRHYWGRGISQHSAEMDACQACDDGQE